MRLQWLSTWLFPWKARLLIAAFSLSVSYVMGEYPESPDLYLCSASLGRFLTRRGCQVAVDNLPRGHLPRIFTTRAHTATNNYIQVPLQYSDSRTRPTCKVSINLDGHSRTDQFVFVPWDEIRQMAQVVVNRCVGQWSTGGVITYGLGNTFESLVSPTPYEETSIPTPAWVWQPDGAVDFVAIPSTPEINDYSEYGCPTPNKHPLISLFIFSKI